MLPATAPVASTLSIRWNDHHIPFVEAGSDRDAAVGLGIVHGHLRLAQMELMRAHRARAACPRSPVASALELDRLVRLIDFPRATEASLALMPDDTRAWAEGFADGINAAAEAALPPEFDTLSIPYEPWTVEQLFAVSRLCSADYAWKVWRTLNPLRDDPEWSRMWAELDRHRRSRRRGHPHRGRQSGRRAPLRVRPRRLATPMRWRARAPRRACRCWRATRTTSSPRPTFGSSPGFARRELSVWGFMIPALPIFGVGRNQHGAWGGTNLHATSSELVDVSGEEIETRTDHHQAGGKAHEVETRQSRFGPIISDCQRLQHGLRHRGAALDGPPPDGRVHPLSRADARLVLGDLRRRGGRLCAPRPQHDLGRPVRRDRQDDRRPYPRAPPGDAGRRGRPSGGRRPPVVAAAARGASCR